MPHFMLLLYDNDSYRGAYQAMTPEDMKHAQQKYLDWRKEPFIRDGQRLTVDPGKVVRSSGGKSTTTDGPYSETKEVLGGYYTIEAADYDSAVAITLTNPHLSYGGTIEVRQVFPRPPQP